MEEKVLEILEEHCEEALDYDGDSMMEGGRYTNPSVFSFSETDTAFSTLPASFSAISFPRSDRRKENDDGREGLGNSGRTL